MYAQVHSPERIAGKVLDDYLAQGWFRMGPTIFTTHFLNFRNELYSAIWMRIALKEYRDQRSWLKLKKTNSRFRWEIRPVQLTPAKEELFAQYKQTVQFETSPSLQFLLYGTAQRAVYDTLEVDVFDGERLIACGFFDMGERSAAGISNIYHPDYRKFSLGRFLIHLKVQHCVDAGLDYFYPGYFVPGYSFFDYKLKIGAGAQYFYKLASGTWESIDSFSGEPVPIGEMRVQLDRVAAALRQLGLPATVFKYDFFEINLMQEAGALRLFDYPLFLLAGGGSITVDPVVVYDVRDRRYHVLKCRSVGMPQYPQATPENFCAHILKTEYELVATAEPFEAALILRQLSTA